MAVFLLATVGTGFLIRVWKLRSGARGSGPCCRWCMMLKGDALRERIRQGDGVLMGMIAGVGADACAVCVYLLAGAESVRAGG